MPRKPRAKSSSGVYHIMLRGINRQVIFEDNEDKSQILWTLKRFKKICQFELYAYCLMDNHIHLLVKESQKESISETIKRISSSYVYWYNMKYERCGHLFQDRFKSENVETKSYFKKVLRYIHQNPLKAGLATNVFDSPWTSIQEYLHTADIVDIDRALTLFSDDSKNALQPFISYTQEANDDECLDDFVKVKLSDSEVREYLHTLGFATSSRLQQMNKGDRDAVLAKLKKLKGVTLGQISRITGISKSVIGRA